MSSTLENSIRQLRSRPAQRGITTRCGANWSLEFESSCQKKIILDVAKRFDELVLVIPIDLQNYANDYTFLIPIHWFKTAWGLHDYDVWPQVELSLFSDLNIVWFKNHSGCRAINNELGSIQVWSLNLHAGKIVWEYLTRPKGFMN